MMTVEEALAAVMDKARPLPPKRLPLAEALGCALAEDVASDLDLPPFAKALVDGYAVRAADVERLGGRFSLGEEVPAGRTPTRPLADGEAALVMTGAPIPEGADAVVMRERARPLPGGLIILEPEGPVTPGQNWMHRGREMRAGDVVLRRGDRLTPARIGLLASVGRAEALIVPRPRVVVVPTGDELVEPDRVPGPGQIRNSNAAMLRALAQAGGSEAVADPIAPDEPTALREALRRALDRADVLLVAGGVSAGDRDLVPAALTSLGITPVFHKVQLKPGKPLWFGVAQGGDGPDRLIFGLPGNPVGGVVCFLLFVRPALAALRGIPPGQPGRIAGRLAAPFVHRGARPTYHPATLTLRAGSPPLVAPMDWAGSADLRTVAGADGFAAFPSGDRVYEAGEAIDFLPLEPGN